MSFSPSVAIAVLESIINDDKSVMVSMPAMLFMPRVLSDCALRQCVLSNSKRTPKARSDHALMRCDERWVETWEDKSRSMQVRYRHWIAEVALRIRRDERITCNS